MTQAKGTDRWNSSTGASDPMRKLPQGNEVISDRENADAPVGARELRIVAALESSFVEPGRYHIHIIKSREMSNARSFYVKVARILRLHGYNVRSITEMDLKKASLDGYNEKTTVLVMEEDLFSKDGGYRSLEAVLGEPVFNNIGKLNLLLVLSEASYSMLAPGIGVLGSKNAASTRSTLLERAPVSYRNYASYGIFLLALSFLVGSVSNILPQSLMTAAQLSLYLTASEIAMVVLTLAGMALVVIAYGNRSAPLRKGVIISIAFFITLFAFAIFGPLYGNLTGYIDSNFFLLLVVNIALLSMFIAKFPLMISGSGNKPAYILSVAGGILLSLFIMFNYSFISVFNTINPGGPVIGIAHLIAGIRVLVSGIDLVLKSSGFPAFGLLSMQNPSISFMDPLFYVPFAGNMLIFVSYVIAFRHLRQE